ncbi:MAG TPA: hypothetical protein VGI16_11460 [Candidatus Acidoferrum sp.]|jgi:hypothetical protein
MRIAISAVLTLMSCVAVCSAQETPFDLAPLPLETNRAPSVLLLTEAQSNTHQELPDAPRAKGFDKEASPCPSGAGEPCAFLGGFRYYPDMLHSTEHDRTWAVAMKHPAEIVAAAVLVAATAVDIEGTHACLVAHTCREINPIMPKKPNRAWAYSVAMGINGVGLYGLGSAKADGKGNKVLFLTAVVVAVHLYFGFQGFAVAGHVRK